MDSMSWLTSNVYWCLVKVGYNVLCMYVFPAAEMLPFHGCLVYPILGPNIYISAATFSLFFCSYHQVSC